MSTPEQETSDQQSLPSYQNDNKKSPEMRRRSIVNFQKPESDESESETKKTGLAFEKSPKSRMRKLATLAILEEKLKIRTHSFAQRTEHEKNRTVRMLIADFFNETTAHGFKKLVGTSLWIRILWFIFIMAFFALFLFNMWIRLDSYTDSKNNPSYSTDLKKKNKLETPSISICSQRFASNFIIPDIVNQIENKKKLHYAENLRDIMQEYFSSTKKLSKKLGFKRPLVI